jgi:hypothetical protein
MSAGHSDQPYSNAATRAEKLAVLRNDQVQGTTYVARAIAERGEELGGRFAHLGREQQVVGQGPSVYPRPPNGPWAGPDPTPDEPPLGIDVNKVEQP